MNKNTEITSVCAKAMVDRIYDDGCYHGYKFGYRTGFKNGVISAVAGYLGYRVVKAACRVFAYDDVNDKPEEE